jgi:thymidylate kinase
MQIPAIIDSLIPIGKIGLEGGPCSGKTSVLKKAKKLIEKAGMLALIVPEAATMLKPNGIHPKDFSGVEYQKIITRLQFFMEQFFEEQARVLQISSGKQVWMLCDRGLLSSSAYLDSDNQIQDFTVHVLQPLDLRIDEIRSSYKGIIHLVTAADGAEEFFTLENNDARDETPEGARRLDRRSLAAWDGIGHIRIVRNVEDDGAKVPFHEKENRAIRYIFELIGKPVPQD